MKLLLKIAVVLVVLLIALVAAVFFLGSQGLNALVKEGIQRGGTYALGVPTTVDSVSVSPFSGKASLEGLEIANPSGFNAPHFFTLGSGGAEVNLASFNSEVIEVPSLRFENIYASIEKKGDAANYKTIMENMKKVTGSGDSKPDSAPGGAEKKLIVNDLLIRDVRVHVDVLGIPGGAATGSLQKLTAVEIPIEEIHLTGVGRTGDGVGGTGVTPAELTSIVVEAVIAAAVRKGGGVIPADLLGDLQGSLAGLASLENFNLEVIGDAPATVQNLADEAAKAVEEGKKAVEDAAEGLKNLIPGGSGG